MPTLTQSIVINYQPHPTDELDFVEQWVRRQHYAIENIKRDLMLRLLKEVGEDPITTRFNVTIRYTDGYWQVYDPLLFYDHTLGTITGIDITLRYELVEKVAIVQLPYERIMENWEADEAIQKKYKALRKLDDRIADKEYRLHGWKKAGTFSKFVDWLTYVNFEY